MGLKNSVRMARFNDEPSIGMDLVKRSDANTVQVANGVKQTLDKLRPVLPAGVQVTLRMMVASLFAIQSQM